MKIGEVVEELVIQGVEYLGHPFFQYPEIEGNAVLAQSTRGDGDLDFPVVTMEFFTLAMEIAQSVRPGKMRLNGYLVHTWSPFFLS